MCRRLMGFALLLGWIVATAGCGNSQIADKPNFETKPLPPPDTTPAEKPKSKPS